MQLEFFGAAGEVTGSCHILRAGGRQLLLDCGMIQGGADAPARNRRAFPFDASDIDAVVLSHAHIDHCGRLPLLVKRGYRGPIHTNRACADLLPILLRDSSHLLMREAERANRDLRRGEEPAQPLFELEDVEAVLRQVAVMAYDQPREVLPGITVRVREAGHILGSSSVELSVAEGGQKRKLVFSGDLGQYDAPILQDPHRFESADLVLMESTYGDRLHRGREDTARELGEILAQAARDGGNVIVPAFAIGRSQELLYLLAKNYAEWHVSRWKIFLDSPMAIAASRVYWNHPERFDQESARLRAGFGGMPPLPNLVLSETPDDSRAINEIRSGAIVIAGSGMANGGRVLHHLRHNLPRPECHVLIVGFQAPGTLGRQLVDRRTEVRIHGHDVPVAAQVHTVGGLSAHADQAQLLRWYGSFRQRPPVYLVHGEVESAQALAAKLRELGAQATVTRPGLTIDLAGVKPLAHD
ncbi:MAG TPA: MBL fold metallo-hydrolase [Steroidobacteraceae bacterium]|jgi:metallo-beta-lactamase family protein|nr:MBL fold metallo-hydrolase [Steroidobacteraceae bacterium]